MKAKTLNLLWGLVLVAAGGLFLAHNLGLIPAPSPLVWAGLLAVASLTFFASYFVSGVANWGWLFPAFVTGAIAAVILLGEMGISGTFVASMILWSVAVPFLVPFVQAPAENWWALIPAGVLATTALTALAAGAVSEAGEAGWLGGIMFLGLAVTFGALWLMRARQPTDWAKYPAAGLLVASLVAFAWGAGVHIVWPLALILLGGWLVIDVWRRREGENPVRGNG